MDRSIKSISFLALIVLVAVLSPVRSQENCPNGDNYSPCTCSGSATNTFITCSGITMSQVRQIFTSTSFFAWPLNVDLRLTATDAGGIPADILDTKKVKTLSIRCVVGSNTPLKVDANAFRWSKGELNRITVQYCDVSQMNFAFLNGFPFLSYVGMTSCSGLDGCLPSLNFSLPGLTSLSFYNSKGLNNLMVYPPALSSGLNDLDSGANGLDDFGVSRLLNWAIESSNQTLQTLYLDSNLLTQPPGQIPNFLALSAIDMSYNTITELRTGSLWLTAPVLRLYVSGNKISRVLPDAFGGDFSKARVMIQSNSLTTFESAVWQKMLLQMSKGTGSLFASGNPYDCTSDPCHLSWLTYGNRALLKSLDTIKCTNNTNVLALDQASFASCPYTCPDDGPQEIWPIGGCKSQFYTCSNLRPYTMDCPSTLVFNPSLSVCDWRYNVPGC